MALEKLDHSLIQEIEILQTEGRAKATERIIVDYVPSKGEKGPRYRLKGVDQEFIRMNSNSYLSLSNHPGLIEAADGGTLFLDEIGDMELDAQAQLLKTIEEKSYRRIGENKIRILFAYK